MTDSISSISSLEKSRNPFESDIEDRLHFPGFSPSMFTTPRTPINEKKKTKEFRWSIGQISVLHPAAIEEYPDQDTSSTVEREQEFQQAIDEYFSQDAIVPSPWTPNRSVKHVTFSPLPPNTKYISSNESSMNSSSVSQNGNQSKSTVDAAVQTDLCLPVDFNLEELLGHLYYNGNDSGDRDLSISSLRRKLFAQGGKTTADKDANNNSLSTNCHEIRSILKHSKTPLVVTSSPLGHRAGAPRTSKGSTSSPDVSPIKRPIHSLAPNSPYHCNEILESSGIDIGDDLGMFPDISPIKDFDKAPVDYKRDSIEQQQMSPEDGDCKEETIEGEGLELSALTVTDDTIDSDSDKPAKVTMEDLAVENDPLSQDDNEEKPAKITMEDLGVDSSDDGSEKKPAAISMEDLSTPCNMGDGKEVEDFMFSGEEDMETSQLLASTPTRPEEEPKVEFRDEHASPKQVSVDISSKYTKEYGTQRFNHITSGVKRSTYELDDDVLMVRAAAALRRADRFHPPKSPDKTYGQPFGMNQNRPLASPRQRRLDLEMSGLPWQPVSMSTPLNPPVRRPRVFGSSSLESDYCPDPSLASYGHEHGPFNQMSFAKLAEQTTPHERVSPVMEDILRKKEILAAGLREASTPSPSYQYGKWRTPRTYPLSYIDRKTLYGKPANRALEYGDVLNPRIYAETKRVSWPPSRPYSPRLSYMNRPSSPPPAWSDPRRIYKVFPEGSVAKMPLQIPYISSNIDSGFEEWKRSISKWEKSIKSQANRLKYY